MHIRKLRLAILLSLTSLTAWADEAVSPSTVEMETPASDAISPIESAAIRIDINKLSPAILNCNVCRMRLGLQPIEGGGTLDAAEHDAKIDRASPAASPATSIAAEVQSLNADQAKIVEPIQAVGTSVADSNSKQAEATIETSSGDAHQQSSVAVNELADNKRWSQFESTLQAQQAPKQFDSIGPVANESPRFSSQSAAQIELELAKRQLKESHELIEKFNLNQSQLESQISQLTLINKQYEASIQGQQQSASRLSEQLKVQASQADAKLKEVQRELEATQRELSIAIAQQKINDQERSDGKDSQVAELQTQIVKLRNDVESFSSQAETMRRQRDGLERELASVRTQSATGSDEGSPSLASVQAKLREAEIINERLKAELSKQQSNGSQLDSEPKVSEQALAKEIESLRMQIEQQAARFLAAQSAWDAERAELLKKSMIESGPRGAALEEAALESPTAKSIPSQDGPPVTSSEVNEATEQVQLENQESQKTEGSGPTSESTEAKSELSPFKAGPKAPLRKPRDAKPKTSGRREI